MQVRLLRAFSFSSVSIVLAPSPPAVRQAWSATGSLPATEAQLSTIEVFGSLQPPEVGEGEKPVGGQESAPEGVHVLPRLNGRAASQRKVMMSCMLFECSWSGYSGEIGMRINQEVQLSWSTSNKKDLETTIYKTLVAGFQFYKLKHRLMLAEEIGRQDEPRWAWMNLA